MLLARVRIRCEYVGRKSVRGFKGNWQSVYTFRDVVTLGGVPVCDSFKLGSSKAIIDQKFVSGGFVEMTVSVTKTLKNVKISRPFQIVKVQTCANQ